MGVMTKRQRGIIEDIESKLGYIFDGNDSPTGAHRFIEKHIDKLDMDNISIYQTLSESFIEKHKLKRYYS